MRALRSIRPERTGAALESRARTPRERASAREPCSCVYARATLEIRKEDRARAYIIRARLRMAFFVDAASGDRPSDRSGTKVCAARGKTRRSRTHLAY